MHQSILSSRQATQRTWRALFLFIAAAAFVAAALTLWLFTRAVDTHRRQVTFEGEQLASELSHEMKLQGYVAQSLARQAEALFAGSEGLTIDVTRHLRPYPEKQGWTFEVPPGFSEREVGNFTGDGEPPAPGSDVARELSVVFALSPGLQSAVDSHPDVPWAYYVSLRHFLYQFPRVTPAEFFWSIGMSENHTKDDGRPLVRGKLYWSPLYEDIAGKGLMATVSVPVFEGETLRGTISVDVSMKTLAPHIAASIPRESYARLLDPRGGDMLDRRTPHWPQGPMHTSAPPVPAEGTELNRYPLPSGWTLEVLTPRAALWRQALIEALPSGLLLLLVFIGTAAVLALRRSLLASQQRVERFVRETEEQNLVLLAAREQADRANRAKSDFVATISHEIRNPLTGVIGLASTLSDDDDLARVKSGLQVLQQSAESLRSVLNDVLDFTKLEAGALELEDLPFDAATAMRSVVELMRARASEQQTRLEAVVDGSVPPWVCGDPTRFRQIVLNLVSNAVKFTEGGAVTCTLRADSGHLSLAVSDTGIGMTPAQQERLFAPWAQAERSTARRFGGTGLGLSIVRRLIDAMGGTISLQSEVGKGSTFTVSIPAEACEPPRRTEGPVQPSSRSLRVLLVDDNPVNRLVFTRLLEKLGHSVKTENDGAKAVEHLAAEGFDVVLMDCHMPEMDGFDATRKLRARGDQVPIVALTGAVTQEERERCFAAGMNGFLAKPADARALREVLASVAP